MISRNLPVVSLAVAALLSGPPALAQEQVIRTEWVRFEAGTTATKIDGQITGHEIVDYVLRAQAGQTMVVTLSTGSGANYFNVMAPGEAEVAFFNGSVADNSYSGTLPETGDYTIRVYQMRSAARRGETARYTLSLEITSGNPGAGAPVRAEAQTDALVPGTEFNATGNIPCARMAGQPMGQCSFGVVRRGDGSGSITVFWHEGGNRVLFFEDGTPMAFDRSEADGDAQMTVGKEADLFYVRIGDQRFEIPEAVFLGG